MKRIILTNLDIDDLNLLNDKELAKEIYPEVEEMRDFVFEFYELPYFQELKQDFERNLLQNLLFEED